VRCRFAARLCLRRLWGSALVVGTL
jgi:hypothetical protein